MTLQEHRQLLKKSNGRIHKSEQERLYSTVKPHLIKAGVKSLRTKSEYIICFVNMIIDTQDGQPFFWIDSKLPFCWNNPRDWSKYEYIRFQWGHLEPTNSLTDCNQLENLCLQSARCNNQIQSSMPLRDLKELFFGSKTYDRIIEVEEKRRTLFNTSGWKNHCQMLLS
jgi:hypothetical protein